MIPENEIWAPISIYRLACSSFPVKQCKTPPTRRKMSRSFARRSVSSKASREWIETGLSVSIARSKKAEKQGRQGDAESWYAQVLDLDPDHPAAGKGVVRSARGIKEKRSWFRYYWFRRNFNRADRTMVQREEQLINFWDHQFLTTLKHFRK